MKGVTVCTSLCKGPTVHYSPKEVHIDPGSLTLTLCYVEFVNTGSFASYSQDHLTKLK